MASAAIPRQLLGEQRRNAMTKKSAKQGAKAKKLGLKKQTLKDLSSLKGKAAAVRGGRAAICDPGACTASLYTRG